LAGWNISGSWLVYYFYRMPAQQKHGADPFHGGADAVR